MYVIYFIYEWPEREGCGYGYVSHAGGDWLTESHEEHGNVLPSESVMMVPGTVSIDD